MEILRIIGENVRKRRLELGMTQEQLADESALDQRFVSAVENGRRNLTVLKLQQLADSLRCTASDFLKP